MASLRRYRAKRNFAKTDEPRGKKSNGKKSSGKKSQRGRYVVHKHAARHLHYDLRLEHDGAMMSWAVTKGPSLVPGDKRLAIHVEDHPIEYNRFEGTIPKGEYGGGTVMIWDRGRWFPDGDVAAGIRNGRLDFRFEGEKLKGRWHLVRIRKRPRERRESWLLIKSHDAFARERGDADILAQKPRSVMTGRSMAEIAAGKAGAVKARRRLTAKIARPPRKRAGR